MALQDKYVTINQAAWILNVTRQTISRWISEKKLPAEKVGRTVLIDRQELWSLKQVMLNAELSSWILEMAEMYAIWSNNYTVDDDIKLRDIREDGVVVMDVKRKNNKHEIACVKLILDWGNIKDYVMNKKVTPTMGLRVSEIWQEDKQGKIL